MSQFGVKPSALQISMGAPWSGHSFPHHLSIVSGLHVLSWLLLAMNIEASFPLFWGLESKSSEHALWPSGRYVAGIWSGSGWAFVGAETGEACVLLGAVLGPSVWFRLEYLGHCMGSERTEEITSSVWATLQTWFAFSELGFLNLYDRLDEL